MSKKYNVAMISDGGHTGKVGNKFKAIAVGCNAVLLYLQKNGSNLARFYNSSKDANQYGPSTSISVLVDLAVKDYLEARLTIGTLHGNDNMYFMGYMIG